MSDGIVRLVGPKLVFEPNVYPTEQVATLGFYRRNGFWERLATLDALDGIQRMFPNVVVETAVFEALKPKSFTPHEIVELSKAMDFQKEGIYHMLANKHTMLALAPGLGKSLCSILAAEATGKSRILVISPLSLLLNWKAQIRQWADREAAIWYGPVRNWERADKWVITNYDTAIRNEQAILDSQFDVIIIDESILVKNRKAQRTKKVAQLTRNVEYLWLLSGSPTSKFYDDMWSQLNIISPRRFSSYWRFASNYCILEKNQWGMAIIANQEYADIRIKKDLADCYFARTQGEVTNIPDWLFDDMEIAMSPSQYDMYLEMETEFLATLPEGDEILAANHLVQLIRLIQIMSNPLLIGGYHDSPIWDAVPEILQYEKMPAIIWTAFKRTAEIMASQLKEKNYRVGVLTGDTDSSLRQQNVDMFQNGQLDILIAHPGVGKFGFTLTAGKTVVYLERTYDGDAYYQSLYRVKRIGTTESPHVIHVIPARPTGKKRTMGHVIAKVLEYRRNSSLKLTSGTIREILKEE